MKIYEVYPRGKSPWIVLAYSVGEAEALVMKAEPYVTITEIKVKYPVDYKSDRIEEKP